MSAYNTLLGVLTPALVMVIGWTLYIYTTYGVFSLTTMSGYHLMQHTGNFFEYVPDQYAALRDTYIKYRDARVAEFGTQGNTIWEAIPEMERVSGLNFFQLSRTLERLSIQLIREHPDLYLRNVASGWWLFWRAPVYWAPQTIAPPLRGILEALVLVERGGLFLANLVFLVTSLLVLFWKKARRSLRVTSLMGLTACLVWAASILQTLLDHGDNPRFLVPLQSWVVLWVLWLAYVWVKNRNTQHG
jgi:hypothetical protein